MSHTTNKELVSSQKIVGVSEAEAERAVQGLYALSLDSEVGLGDKGTAAKIARTLQMNLAKSPAREEAMAAAMALVARLS